MFRLGSFCLDSDMGEVMRYSGVTLMGCGIAYVLAFFLMNKGIEYSTVRTDAK
jgi:hypothetical protein